MLVYGKYECFIMHMLYVCVLCASCGNCQCCMTCSLLMLVEMPSQIPCGSVIETTHVHYGSFLLFLSQFLQCFEVGSPISISRSCLS